MTVKDHTYERRLGWRNVERKTCLSENGGCGQVHEWMTRGCSPVIVPDEWAEDGLGGPYEPLPEDIEGVRIPQ